MHRTLSQFKLPVSKTELPLKNTVTSLPIPSGSPICQSIYQFLSFHFSILQGRTGVMVCACLLQLKLVRNGADALFLYGDKRTEDGKGVTIPSQRRYVQYYDMYLRQKLPYTRTRLWLNAIHIRGVLSQPGM